MASLHQSAVSAPGKVLLAGGYLVLDKDYLGLVFGLSARIHTVSRPIDSTDNIIVRSPQFSGAEWRYSVENVSNDTGTVVSQIAGASKNPFVQTTICYVSSYLSRPSVPGLSITIYADNDYYSQSASDGPLPRFNPLNVPISMANKTGLGSSAALVTSLTACLLSSLSPQPFSLSDQENLNIVHNLAQAAHCAAQGKVGSGFDVAAAVFGSCVYHRFSPRILEDVGDAGTTGFSSRLRATIHRTWDLKVDRTRVPRGLRIVMGDVNCGSSTPGMVKKVLAWKKEVPAVATSRWDTIEALNKGLIRLLEEEDPGLKEIRAQIEAMRSNIRAMGEAAGVPIEPEEQTKLLNAATERVGGVIGGVVPGAGGYDAVVFVLEDKEETVEGLRKFVDEYEFVGPDGARGRVTLLGSREELEGIREEDIASYNLYV